MKLSSQNKKDTWIVIAAWNEEKRVGKVLKGLQKEGFRNIVVVDDGSKDKTFDVASKEGVLVVKHPINRGQGAALQTGMEVALENDAKFLVHFDADDQHDPNDLPVILSPLVSGRFDVTLGSRFKGDASGLPWHRKVMIKVAIFVNFFLYGVLLSDAHNGYRGFTRSAAEKCRMVSDGAEHASEVIDLVKKNRLKYVEVPVHIKYNDEVVNKEFKTTSFFNSVKVGFKLLLRKLL